MKSNYPSSQAILVLNKIDKLDFSNFLKKEAVSYISAKQGLGVKDLLSLIEKEACSSVSQSNEFLINERQRDLLERASKHLALAMESAKSDFQNEIVSIDIRAAIKPLGELSGENWSEEVLNNIFSKFCIGK